jgi:hypothetical protein
MSPENNKADQEVSPTLKTATPRRVISQPRVYRKGENSFFKRHKNIVRLVLLLIIAGGVYFSYWHLTCKGDKADDMLVHLSMQRSDCSGAANYVDYIVNRIKNKGYYSIEDKWVDDLPPKFKQDAKAKLLNLKDNGFEIERVAVDRVKTYNVRCRSNSDAGKLIFVEVVKVKRPNRKPVFRLQRVY